MDHTLSELSTIIHLSWVALHGMAHSFIELDKFVIINLDSVLKRRDITLQTKVCIVKAMVFPVVMYGCDSWTIKKLSAEELMP